MASYKLKNVYLDMSVAISSNNERINTDYKMSSLLYGHDNAEDAQIKMNKIIFDDIQKKYKLDLLIGSDLSNQIYITNEVLMDYHIPYLGIYNACSSYVEGIIISASLLKLGKIKNIGVLVSSHNLTSEKTYRYPVEYGFPKKECETFTATGAVVSVVTNRETNIKIESCTIGKVVDYNIKDSKNMGAVMAPGAAETILDHLKDLKRDINYYDLIMTGDLGKIGKDLLEKILGHNNIKLSNYIDAGSILITDKKLTCAGASGPACLPLILTKKIIPEGKYKKILVIGTGSLHSKDLVNRNKSIPCISHAISLEVSD